jgi:hypothetical protein
VTTAMSTDVSMVMSMSCTCTIAPLYQVLRQAANADVLSVENLRHKLPAMPMTHLKSSGNIPHAPESGIERVHIFEQDQHGTPKLEWDTLRM